LKEPSDLIPHHFQYISGHLHSQSPPLVLVHHNHFHTEQGWAHLRLVWERHIEAWVRQTGCSATALCLPLWPLLALLLRLHISVSEPKLLE
jgi:hypothetical protein